MPTNKGNDKPCYKSRPNFANHFKLDIEDNNLNADWNVYTDACQGLQEVLRYQPVEPFNRFLNIQTVNPRVTLSFTLISAENQIWKLIGQKPTKVRNSTGNKACTRNKK